MQTYTFIWTIEQYEQAFELLLNSEYTINRLYASDDNAKYISEITCDSSCAVLLHLI